MEMDCLIEQLTTAKKAKQNPLKVNLEGRLMMVVLRWKMSLVMTLLMPKTLRKEQAVTLVQVAQTRLKKRSHRPDVESCNDPPHNRLVRGGGRGA